MRSPLDLPVRTSGRRYGMGLGHAVSRDQREEFRPPRPMLAGTLLLGVTSLPMVVWAAAVVTAPGALVFGVSLALLALVHSGLGAYDLHRCRRLADSLLQAYPGLAPVSGLAVWRAAELISARHRREVARLVGRLRLETEACARSSSSRVADRTLDQSLFLLRKLERRLEILSAPVSPHGMLRVHSLAIEDLSPLYFPERAAALPAALTLALAALEVE